CTRIPLEGIHCVMFGRRLRQLRKQRGLTQPALEALSGVGRAYISALERGERTNPSRDVIQALADALGVTGADLAGAAWVELEDVPVEKGSPTYDLHRLLSVWSALSPLGRTTLLKIALALESEEAAQPVNPTTQVTDSS